MDSVAYIAAHDAVYVLATYDYSNPAKLSAVFNDGKALRPPMPCVLSADTADAKMAADSNCLWSRDCNMSIGFINSPYNAFSWRIDAASFDKNAPWKLSPAPSRIYYMILWKWLTAICRSIRPKQNNCHWPHR